MSSFSTPHSIRYKSKLAIKLVMIKYVYKYMEPLITINICKNPIQPNLRDISSINLFINARGNNRVVDKAYTLSTKTDLVCIPTDCNITVPRLYFDRRDATFVYCTLFSLQIVQNQRCFLSL